MKVFSFSNLPKISLEVQGSALSVPIWRIKRQGFPQVLAQGYVACHGKLRTLTTP